MSMALIKCKECGHNVSTTATTCPNCGTPDFVPDDVTAKERKEQHLEHIQELLKEHLREQYQKQLKKRSAQLRELAAKEAAESDF